MKEDRYTVIVDSYSCLHGLEVRPCMFQMASSNLLGLFFFDAENYADDLKTGN